MIGSLGPPSPIAVPYNKHLPRILRYQTSDKRNSSAQHVVQLSSHRVICVHRGVCSTGTPEIGQATRNPCLWRSVEELVGLALGVYDSGSTILPTPLSRGLSLVIPRGTIEQKGVELGAVMEPSLKGLYTQVLNRSPANDL
ncbi:uncharacterized protein BDW43DRAFT_261498 [Aspergillus alliaceus]|uniref:uncharacterized protein n=1 Tax=Petromyces alliaceus TaxID=209559 RepID=UPI0012A3E366|nr:uncharacterized protein BDW43DRAFT_261498 [Aspergillus alliaceus]KAB8238376.1 hypothetical protein BDW43DRAFT_261498 [Aspergillus alliaceus]